jgi:hypothetical protein
MTDVFVVVIGDRPMMAVSSAVAALLAATVGGGSIRRGYLLPGQKADARTLLKIGEGVCRSN